MPFNANQNFIYSLKSGIKSISFNTPGLVTLPSWLSFSCASTRTAQISANALIKNVSTNQAVANMWGLQHEPSATNYCVYSENFGSWAKVGAATRTLGITDPAGGTTGATITTVPNDYGYYPPAQVIAGNICISGWVKTNTHSNIGTTSGAAQPTWGFTVPSPGNGSVWQLYSGSWNQSSNATSPIISNTFSTTTAPGGDTTATGGNYAFVQMENSLFPSSYIITPSSAPITRAMSFLTFKPKTQTSFSFRFDFIAAAPSTGYLQALIVNENAPSCYNYIGVDGKINSHSGNDLVDTNALVWVPGDKISFRFKFNNTTSYTINVYKNDVFYYTKTFTHSAIPTFNSSGQTFIASNSSGTFLYNKGITYVSMQ